MPRSDVQQRVQHLIDELVGSGEERGLQVAAYIDGERIVDAWSGIADPARGTLVDGDTLFPIYSTGKGMTATALHLLAARGRLRYDEPIATWWPEFAAQGKERITMRHAMAHLAGLPQMPEVTLDALNDWPRMCREIAALSPLWPPGSRTYYHAITYSWLLGEVARRVDGRPFERFVQEELCAPLGLVDSLFLGMSASEYARVASRIAPVEPEPPQPRPAASANAAPAAPDPIAERSIPAYVKPLEDWMNRPDARRSCVPSSTGIMTARAIARHYAALIGDGVDGVRLLDEATVCEATQRNRPSAGSDPNEGFGLGYALMGPAEAPGSVFGHGGYGGSVGLADARASLAIGVAKNRMTGGRPQGSTADRVIAAIRSALPVREDRS